MAKKNKKEDSPESRITSKMQEVLETLQNLFILESVKAGIPSGEIRNILKINQNRITAVSKHVKTNSTK